MGNLNSKIYTWSPETEIADLSGKTIIVTGGSDGIGKATVEQLAKHNPALIYLAARNKSKSEAAIADIHRIVPGANITHLPLDLTSFASIKSAASTVLSHPNARLHLLINNAGIMACPPGLTAEGYEVQFGVNHMGHALLTHLLLPLLRETAKDNPEADVRVVTLSSTSEMENENPWGVHFEALKTDECGGLQTWDRYGQAKLANVLFGRALAAREAEVGSGVRSMVVHPGIVKSNLARGMVEERPWLAPVLVLVRLLVWPPLMLTLYQGAKSTLWTATSPEAKSGSFYYPVGKEMPGGRWSQDVELRGRLWEWTQKEIASHVG